MRRQRAVMCVLATVLFSAATATAIAAQRLPAIPDSAGTAADGVLQVRPATIVYSGDGSHFFAGVVTHGASPHDAKIRWISWTATGATANATDVRGNCLPTCANGGYSTYP